MIRLLLGMLLGAAVSSMWKNKASSGGTRAFAPGRVDELSSAKDNIVADPPVNVGDGTPGRSTSTTGATITSL